MLIIPGSIPASPVKEPQVQGGSRTLPARVDEIDWNIPMVGFGRQQLCMFTGLLTPLLKGKAQLSGGK